MRSAGPFVYLDHNATTRVRPEAAAAMMAVLESCGNASSVHRAGREARGRLAAARAAVARAIGLPKDGDIVFTGGGTEANNLALCGLGRRVLRSAIEHDSVRGAAKDAVIVPVEPSGVMDLVAFERLLAVEPARVLVSVMAANNETGVIQPIAELTRLAHAAGAIVHCDAIQAVGKLPFDMTALGVDLVSVSAHKLGGPQGVGALAIGPGVPLVSCQKGGMQERGFRAGTENLPGIAGFAAAIEVVVNELDGYAGLAELRDAMERRLLEIEPTAIVFGVTASRLPNTSCVALPGVGAETQVISLDLAGVAVSSGAACSSGKVWPSHVLQAMGAAPELSESAIRISLGRDTQPGDIAKLVDAWAALVRRTAEKRSAA